MTKYSFEAKLQAVLAYLEGKASFQEIAKQLNVSSTSLKNWVNHYRENGEQGLLYTYTKYDIQFKMDVLNYMNDTGASLMQTAAVFKIPSHPTILSWKRKLEEDGLDALKPKKKGRPSMKKKPQEPKKPAPSEGSEQALQAENERLRAENAYLKKLPCLNSRKRKITEQDKAQIIYELRQEHMVRDLIRAAEMPRSTYYYWVKQMNRPDKYKEIKELIAEIYHEHKGRYGYRRITLVLRNKGIRINHKTVRGLMGKLGLKSLVRLKKYKSYRGQAGRIASDKIQRDFYASKPHEKLATDVTEIHLHGEKLYFSPVIDLYNGEVIAYNMEHRPVYPLVSKMLDQVFERLNEGDSPILHSDQGWHYQMKQYQHALKKNGITQSMSRKGNCLDNAAMESFFGVMKSELLYLNEFESMEHFKHELEDYIHYYNHKRIKAKLKGMSPVQYRAHTSKAA
ncbi:IS3 family transposase [Fictibacillus nanhaiensis]|uniref:IS3 family transposase n=1 Tax=Fictibacillus nanhaiensis TaxID=742169 RepID=UPI002E21FE1B|nr:IS3 family transposase [Fictibacillus nanhaiensis]MED1865965.1 IS3 family transposase [Fictibacillus nanhaiensis]